jgi:hypothetical protein
MNDNAIECDEWIADSRHKQVITTTFFMALAYGLYAVLNLFLATKGIAQPVGLQYLLSVAFIFLILSLLAYSSSTQFLAFMV